MKAMALSLPEAPEGAVEASDEKGGFLEEEESLPSASPKVLAMLESCLRVACLWGSSRSGLHSRVAWVSDMNLGLVAAPLDDTPLLTTMVRMLGW